MHHLSRCSADFPVELTDDFRHRCFHHQHSVATRLRRSAAPLESQAVQRARMVESPVSPQALTVG